MSEAVGRARAVVLGPDDGESFWQPEPANGFVRNLLNQKRTGGEVSFSMGVQTVAPGCFIREHTHDTHEEVIFVVEGRGVARIEGVDHPIEKGSCVYIGCGLKHHFLNPEDEPLSFTFLLMPGGLDAFFTRIGRPKSVDQPAPEPFPRPHNIAEIERETVFGWVDTGFNQEQ